MFASESFDGDIYEGVTKGGHVLFNLEKTPIDDLKSFKMIWSTSHDNGTPDDYDDDYYKDNELEINIYNNYIHIKNYLRLISLEDNYISLTSPHKKLLIKEKRNKY